MSVAHCQYCGVPADVRVYVKAINGSQAPRAITGFHALAVCACMAHASRSVSGELFTRCVDTGKPCETCDCFWCAALRREAQR